MKKQWFAIVITVATATTALLVLFGLMGDIGSGISTPALAAPLSLTVTAVDPAVAPNDLDTPIIITGTGFTAELSGTLVITPPTAYLGNTAMEDVTWVNSTTLSATVPWGMVPEVYSLTVVNPDGISATLSSAFTVTNGIGVWTTGGPYGGNVPQVLVSPSMPTIVYAVADGVALFASYDSAQHWEPILEGKTYDFRIAMDAVDPNEIFAGGGGYVYRTQDGGDTWDELIGRGHELHHCYVHHLATHPNVSGSVYDAVSACSGWTPPVDRSGIYFSDDHGDSWLTRTMGLTGANPVDLAFHPTDPDIMAAVTRAGNVFTTTNGGLSWHWAADLGEQLRRIYFNPDGNHEAWIVPHAEFQPPSAPYLFKSTDPSLNTWITTVVTDTLIPSGGIWSLNFISGTVWAAGERGYTSDDGGATWTLVMDDESPIHTIKTFAFHPGDEQTIYVGSEMDGVTRSTDGGATWQEKNEGLAGLQARELATPRNEIDTIYVNTFERGILRSDNGGQAWVELAFFHGGRPKGRLLSTDPLVPDRVYLGFGCDVDFPCIQISEDRGVTWRAVTMTLPITWAGEMGELMTAVPHPLVPGRILASAGFCRDIAHCNSGNEPNGFYASDDYGESWSYLGPTTPISEVLNIAYDSRNPDLIYASTNGMGLWKSTDGGNTWAVTSFTNTNYINYVITHPNQENKVYLASSTIDDSVNYVSDDAGETWVRVESQIEYRAPILFTPAQPPLLYAACEFGEKLCRSNDSGNTWEIVPGMTFPIALAAGADGERVVLYVGTPGGMVSQAGAQTASTPNAISGDVTILSGGVYRLTIPLPTNWVYLPLVLRGYAP